MLIRWGHVSLLALLAVFTLFVAGDVRDAASQESDEPTAGPGAAASLDDIVAASGAVESADTIEIRSEVPGQNKIVEMAADGAEVKQGDLIVQLDDSQLRNHLAAQQVAVAQARAVLEQAEAHGQVQNAAAESNRQMLALRLEIAQLELKRYQDAELPLETRRSESRIQIAEEHVSALSERVENLQSHEQAVAKSDLDAVRVELTEARADLDLARNELRLLTEYDGPLTVKKLELAVVESRRAVEEADWNSTASRAEAEAGLAAARLALDEAEQQLSRTRDAIEKCAIRAPRDGVILHAVLPSRRVGNIVPQQIVPQQIVREGRLLLTMPDLSRLQVALTVTGEKAKRVRVGQPVRIFVGDSEEQLTATVALAHPPQIVDGRPVATVLVDFDEPPAGLRIGTGVRAIIGLSDAEPQEDSPRPK